MKITEKTLKNYIKNKITEVYQTQRTLSSHFNINYDHYTGALPQIEPEYFTLNYPWLFFNVNKETNEITKYKTKINHVEYNNHGVNTFEEAKNKLESMLNDTYQILDLQSSTDFINRVCIMSVSLKLRPAKTSLRKILKQNNLFEKYEDMIEVTDNNYFKPYLDKSEQEDVLNTRIYMHKKTNNIFIMYGSNAVPNFKYLLYNVINLVVSKNYKDTYKESNLEEFAYSLGYSQEEYVKKILEKMNEQCIKKYDTVLNRLNREINACVTSFYDLIRDKKETERKRLYLQTKTQNQDDFLEFIKESNKITSITNNGNGNNMVSISFEGTLSNYDEEEAELIIKNESNFRYQEPIRYVLNAIFLEQKYKIKIVGTVNIDLENGGMSYSNLSGIDTAMYNPHLSHYSCFGTSKIEVSKAIADGDLTAAFVAAQYAVFNLNFGDSAVFNSFKKDIEAKWDKKVCVDKQGNSLSFNDIYIIEKNKEEEEEQQ